MKIILYSSGQIGIFYLNKLLENNINIVAGVPNKNDYLFRNELIKKQIPVITINDFKDLTSLDKIKKYQPDLQIVCCFRIIPKYIWSYPKYKTINIHYSLLPSYRGAAPVEWTIINKEKVTGVSIHYINNLIDKGDIISQQQMEIKSYKKTQLYNELNKLGIKMLLQVIDNIKNNNVEIIKPKYKSSYYKRPSFIQLLFNGLL